MYQQLLQCFVNYIIGLYTNSKTTILRILAIRHSIEKSNFPLFFFETICNLFPIKAKEKILLILLLYS